MNGNTFKVNYIQMLKNAVPHYLASNHVNKVEFLAY